MKKFNSLLSLIVAFAMLFCFTGCKKDYFVMEKTFFNTTVYLATDKNLSKNKQDEILNSLKYIEDEFISYETQYHRSSFIQKFNELPVGEQLLIPIKAKKLLLVAKNAYEFTNGKYNPSTLPLLESWKLSASTFNKNTVFVSIPQSIEIETGLQAVEEFGTLDISKNSLLKPSQNFKLDLGGVAKGYAVDEIVNILKDEQISKGYISIGGSSIYIFSTEEDLKIIHPRKSGEYILSVNKSTLNNRSLSTSGDYIRFYVDEHGKRYSHIIDTETGYPIDTGFQSVTVVGKTGAECDAISTALCAMQKLDFINFVKTSLTDCKVYSFYQKDNLKLILTNANENEFSVLDPDYQIEYIK